LHSRHIADSAGGSSSLREDIEGFAFFIHGGREPSGLQIEHRL
jgi:hypothetical protein